MQEASLRRVAGLVAAGAASSEVFAAVAHEVAQVTGSALVQIQRYEPDGTVTVAGAWGTQPHPFQPGTKWGLEGSQIAAEIKRTGSVVRVDDFGDATGPIAEGVRQTGIRGGAGAPIVVDGELWGSMAAGPARGEPVPEGLEHRLAEFTELVATAISNAESRAALARLADEQAALRRVATLVAKGVPSQEVFEAVARELGELLGANATHLARYGSDGTVTGIATWSADGESVPIGMQVEAEGESIAVPIVVDDRRWGLMILASKDEDPLPPETKGRITDFTELVATAIANAEARAELAASRARVVAAADEERRRVVRDLHDGAQQQLVNTIITLKLADRELQDQEDRASQLVKEALAHAESATEELRELAHGILPAVLTRGGLRAGADALASRMPIPVEVDVSAGRLPEPIEATAYFVVAEALTNVAKHARAQQATVTAHVDDGALRVEVRDDGAGGARPEGSGLLGLRDRLAALDGTLTVDSSPGGGTVVAATIPLPR